jgi:hypothetical protein
MRFNSLHLTCDDIKNCADSIIAHSFIENIFKEVDLRGGLDEYNYFLDFTKESITVKDVSKVTHKSHFDIVCLDLEQNYILVHPVLGSNTICEITGLGTFGSINLRMSVCTENILADHLEFSVFITSFRITDPNKYISRGEHDISLGHIDWFTLDAMKPVELKIPVTHSCPSMAIYLCSRIPKGGNMDYAWLRVRNLMVELVD